jgi:hypothetical protein
MSNTLRYTLGILLFLIAATSFAGGYYLMAGAEDLPTNWLDNTPFPDYFVPGLLLFSIVGGVSLFAALEVFMRLSAAQIASVCASIVLLVWISVEVILIGYVSWMQPVTFAVGTLALILSAIVPRPTRREVS